MYVSVSRSVSGCVLFVCVHVCCVCQAVSWQCGSVFNFFFFLQPVGMAPVDIHWRDWHMTVVPAVWRRYQRGSVSKNLRLPLWSGVFMTACVHVNTHLVPPLCGFFLIHPRYSAPCSCLNRADCQSCACLRDRCVFFFVSHKLCL